MSNHSLSPSPGAQQRKPHRCRTCNMPMKGHPRNGCFPYAHSDAKAPVHIIGDDNDDDAPTHLDIHLQDAMLASGMPKPIMPGAFSGRPSDISLATDQSPSKSLRDRIGIKLEGEDSRNPRIGSWLQESQQIRHQTAPAQNLPAGQPGRPRSAFGSGSSSSSSTSIAPNHSISQRPIHRDRTKSEVASSFPKRQLSRLGSIISGADLIARNNEPQDDDLAYGENPGLEDDDENGDPSDSSTVNGASSVSSWYASESDAGTFSSSGGGSSISFGALVRGSGAAPLMTAYEIGSKYVPFMRDRARRAGFKVQVLPGPDDDGRDGRDPNSTREPGMVRIMISRGEGIKDIIKPDAKRAKWAGKDGYGPNDQLRRRQGRGPEDLYGDFNPAYPPQTPHRLPNPHGLPMNPQAPDFMHAQPLHYPPPYPPAVVPPPPQQRSWIHHPCVLFFVVVFAVVVGAVITILVLDHLPVSE